MAPLVRITSHLRTRHRLWLADDIERNHLARVAADAADFKRTPPLRSYSSRSAAASLKWRDGWPSSGITSKNSPIMPLPLRARVLGGSSSPSSPRWRITPEPAIGPRLARTRWAPIRYAAGLAFLRPPSFDSAGSTLPPRCQAARAGAGSSQSRARAFGSRPLRSACACR